MMNNLLFFLCNLNKTHRKIHPDTFVDKEGEKTPKPLLHPYIAAP
jgi:hypothetical protein